MHVRGGPEALVYEDAPFPKIEHSDALVRVHAAGITPTEFTWNSTFTTIEGKDRLPIIPAFEVSGTVEEVGSDVLGLASGDAVFGLLNFWRNGSGAEYVSVLASDLAPKPKSLDHARASCVPLSGLTAWQSLFDYAGLERGQRVLIHGGGGGVGSFAVQFAHFRGAHVICTASGSKIQLLRDLGADDVIDYRSARFDEKVRDLDVVLDTVGNETLERSWKVVRRGGVLITIVGDVPQDKAEKYGVRAKSILVQPSRPELIQIADLIDGGLIRPVVEAVFPLSDARSAYEQGLAGHNSGKTVLQVVL